ncbi:hypothetical protein ACFLVG_03640 [Chloroflexota bacterium]
MKKENINSESNSTSRRLQALEKVFAPFGIDMNNISLDPIKIDLDTINDKLKHLFGFKESVGIPKCYITTLYLLNEPHEVKVNLAVYPMWEYGFCNLYVVDIDQDDGKSVSGRSFYSFEDAIERIDGEPLKLTGNEEG